MRLFLYLLKSAALTAIFVALLIGAYAGVSAWRLNAMAETLLRRSAVYETLEQNGAAPAIEDLEWLVLSASLGRTTKSAEDVCLSGAKAELSCEAGGAGVPAALALEIVQSAPQRDIQHQKTAIRWSLERKLASRYSAQSLVRTYLDLAYFGVEQRGVSAAAQAYFAKKVSDLEPVEAVALGVVNKRPGIQNRPADWMQKSDSMLLHLGATTP
jgi:hypothetical protein